MVIYGFGGMGKTALAREAAEWFTRTGFYNRADFVSFEQGGDVSTLLSTLGHFLGIYDSSYNPQDIPSALVKIGRTLKKQRLFIIADNLESILPNGEATLEPALRTQLWQALLELRRLGAGVLLTTRDTTFGDGLLAPGKYVMHLSLAGLFPQDAYLLASRVLTDLGIDRARAPYPELRGLLVQLDYHPLAIQLVLPSLRHHSLTTIRADFAALLPQFTDDTTTGRNRSLLASLDYSLRRLSPEQRTLLSRLAVFEGGTTEADLLAITEISETEWTRLRPALEQAALLTAERLYEAIRVPFLHFHPVLVPYLRSQPGADDAVLRQRYAQRYYAVAYYYYDQDSQHPEPVRALVRRELPNLRRALALLLEENEVDAASDMVARLAQFLTTFGMMREREQLRQRVVDAVTARGDMVDGALTYAEYLRESGLAEDERRRGNVRAASTRLSLLLSRIQAQPEGTDVGPGSFAHSRVLQELGSCLRTEGQSGAAEEKLRQALAFLDALLKQESENRSLLGLYAGILGSLGIVLSDQGHYTQAQAMYEHALERFTTIADRRNQAMTLEYLGTLALHQRDYGQARSHYLQALEQFRALGEPVEQAGAWHQLGRVAQVQGDWTEAERYYRESLALEEQLGNRVGAAQTCNQLARVAQGAGRPEEAEGWYKRAIELMAQVEPGSTLQAGFLNNLADLLVNEVRTERAPKTRLAEARQYAEQARHVKEQPGVSAEIWTTFSILAKIAELEEQPEAVRDYRRRERESFAAFAGNRYQIDQQFADFIAAIVTATRGDVQALAAVEVVLPELEKAGWHISAAVQSIWKGERDWHALAEGVDRNSALLILRVLETLEDDAGVIDVEGRK